MAFDYWNWDGDSTTIVDAVTSPLPTRTLGQEVTFTLLFSPVGRATNWKDRFLEIRLYARYAGRGEWGVAHEGEVWYQERLPAGAPVNSNVVQLRPEPTDVDGIFEGVWGLVVGMGDGNRLASDLSLDVELFLLADASDYADRSAVEAALAESPV